MAKLTIATRKSPLALWQAEHVKQLLQQAHPHLVVELLPLSTEGDRFLESPLYQMGGKGLFVKELETAMLNQQADIAVHSLKDMPYQLPSGLTIGAICKRENAADVFVSNQFKNIYELPFKAKVGTCSLRRSAQLLLLRPDLEIHALRGNVATRLKKLDTGEYAAIILAYAGLHRLGLIERMTAIFSPQEMLPAVGQGALAIEARENDSHTLNLLKAVEHRTTRLCVTAERSFNQTLEGGCHAAIAAHAEIRDEHIFLRAWVASADLKTSLQTSGFALLTEAVGLGQRLAQQLLDAGAAKFLARLA